MGGSIIFLIIIIVVAIIGFFYSIIYNKFQDSIIKLNEVEGKIDETLRSKFDGLLEMNNIIKEKINTKKAIVDDITKLKDEEISSFELDRKLSEALSKINFIRKQYEELHNIDQLNKLSYDIDDMDESLAAYKKYYNENIVEYNKLIRKFPYNIIGMILKYKEKSFFDGKDLNDENIKDFIKENTNLIIKKLV